MAVVDFHSHILPGIDDGSKDIAMTEKMLRMAAEQEIDWMAATPHFYADSMSIDGFLRRRQAAFDKAAPVAAANGIRLMCGAEVAFFSGMSRAEQLEKLCFDGTNVMMVEMPFREWSARDLQEIERLLRRGIRPIIAHAERFYQFQTDRQIIPELLEMPVYVQINAGCLLHWRARRQAMKLFANGQAQLLGSDCHNISSRPQNLAEGRAVLRKKFGKSLLEQIDEQSTALLGVDR